MSFRRRRNPILQQTDSSFVGEPYTFFKDPDGYEIEVWFELYEFIFSKSLYSLFLLYESL